jgi:cell division ATPase FtsA
LAEFAAAYFSCPVRVASLRPLAGLPSAFNGPAFATAIGLVQIASEPAAGVRWHHAVGERSSYLRRMGQWLHQSF